MNKNLSTTAISKEFKATTENEVENQKEENPDLPEKIALNAEVLSSDKEEEQYSQNIVFPNIVMHKESLSGSPESCIESVKIDSKIKEQIDAYKASEQKTVNIIHMIYVLVLVGLSFVTSALIGSKSLKSAIGLHLCEGGYFGILFSYIIIMLGCSLIVIMY